MFYSFKHVRPGSVAKRKKARRACEYCRQHRVRCDGAWPCSQCVANNIQCNKPSLHSSRSAFSPRAPGLAQQLQPAVSCGVSTPAESMEFRLHSPLDSAPVPVTAPDRLDSFTGFISRLRSFSSGFTHMSVNQSSPSSEIPVSETSYFRPELFKVAEQDFSQISPTSLQNLRGRLLEVFWSRYHWLVPIASRDDFANPESVGKLEPLREALLAYCLQSIFHGGLHHRLLGIRKAEVQLSGRLHNPLVSLFTAWFQKALASNGQYLPYTEPSLADVQRHVFLAAFLLDAGEYQAAYNITGVAIRLAQSLNLQHQLAAQRSAKTAEKCERTWWMLVHLDFRCSRYLDKPMAVNLRESTVPVPESISCPASVSSGLVFYTTSVWLTIATKKVSELLATDQAAIREQHPLRRAEICAECLSQHITHLFQLRDRIQESTPFPYLTLACRTFQPHAHTSGEIPKQNDDAWIHNQPSSHILQQTLIELQYHDIAMGFYRFFVQFPNRDLVPQRSPRADIHATTALQHALTIIDIIHSRMSSHDALYGYCDIYQYVWNAVLTLIGFLFAYPQCFWHPLTREHVEISLQIFELAKTSNPIASQAAHLTGYLLGRVDVLMGRLMSDTPANRHTGQPAGSRNLESQVTVHSEQESANPPVISSEVDDLWSWADMVDYDTWSGYCHDVDEIITDIPNIALRSSKLA
ncbi:hypothetical protein BDV06DRAFT_233660 [Aspergillus oleicola]